MVQRYYNESKSQQGVKLKDYAGSCFQWFKDTKMKANHNSCLQGVYAWWAVSNGSKIRK